MKNSIGKLGLFLLFTIIFSCAKKVENPFNTEELTPWCLVNFDSLERSPTDRIAMLREMGFTKYGYNWDNKHLDQMKEEFALARENNLEIVSIFLWLNAKRDSIGKLSPANERMLEIISEVENKPAIWLSFSDNFYEDLNQVESISLAIEFIKFVKSKTDNMGCKLALYNHRGWFGNPFNQVEIIKRLPEDSISMVYNFHHAHHYLDEFPEVVKTIKPYLSYVNLNGMRKEGPEILTIGQGDQEAQMIKLLLDEGYNGPWSILGHIKTEDVKVVLDRNLNGLKSLNLSLE
ncbi:MAG: sugar phosphate isomerase/epimerase [Bacteroidia bacterium]|nr:sugar phosphate isomerase/epimerase [Bacteroidia bacterium]